MILSDDQVSLFVVLTIALIIAIAGYAHAAMKTREREQEQYRYLADQIEAIHRRIERQKQHSAEDRELIFSMALKMGISPADAGDHEKHKREDMIDVERESLEIISDDDRKSDEDSP